MKENLDKEVHLKVSESEENAYLILLEAMYCGDVWNEKMVGELLAVLELANKYDLKFIFKKCICSSKKRHYVRSQHSNNARDSSET